MIALCDFPYVFYFSSKAVKLETRPENNSKQEKSHLPGFGGEMATPQGWRTERVIKEEGWLAQSEEVPTRWDTRKGSDRRRGRGRCILHVSSVEGSRLVRQNTHTRSV